jgi:histidine triad (HIT) family protein
MSSVFTEIIQGELPCYKIYEDERTFAFLDIEPEAPGHTLVIPKAEVDKVYDLSDEDYQAVWATVKMLAKHFEEVLGERTMIKVVGTDVPHAHVHVLPVNENWAGDPRLKMTPEEMEAMAEKLRVE